VRNNIPIFLGKMVLLQKIREDIEKIGKNILIRTRRQTKIKEENKVNLIASKKGGK